MDDAIRFRIDAILWLSAFTALLVLSIAFRIAPQMTVGIVMLALLVAFAVGTSDSDR
ncbi:hypothetical protein [Halorhabdus amylolytica]|uniref:hypothetical protein n=1 Tax=Halorhabdus amylolytica TaxID=2559573 RepID=UPI00145B810D|nr:hypothetical protein [Halorhabdus amylolytica]